MSHSTEKHSQAGWLLPNIPQLDRFHMSYPEAIQVGKVWIMLKAHNTARYDSVFLLQWLQTAISEDNLQWPSRTIATVSFYRIRSGSRKTTIMRITFRIWRWLCKLMTENLFYNVLLNRMVVGYVFLKACGMFTAHKSMLATNVHTGIFYWLVYC